ncbi:Fic family protein [Spiroplasma endosymbiont of Crioceris asparagi]|uniref:Fic family protein n=1 Tax=Spiroplasma endosymbiont of Crioceris asparagi TaxID=3066286 RepID=UPI0030D53377
MKKNLTSKIFANFWLDNAYNSSHIEGNKLTANTVDLLLLASENNINDIQLNIEPNRQGFDRSDNVQKELYKNEIIGFKEVIHSFIDNLKSDQTDLQKLAKDFHYFLMGAVFQDNNKSNLAGNFKTSDSIIILKSANEKILTSNASDVENDLDFLFTNYKNKMAKATNLKQKLLALAYMHIGFESIHPFIDGNGRTGRLLLAYEAMRNNLPPFHISNEGKYEYFLALEECTVNPNTTNFNQRTDLSDDKLEKMVFVFSNNLQNQLGRIANWDDYKMFQLTPDRIKRIDEFIEELNKTLASDHITLEYLLEDFQINNFEILIKENGLIRNGYDIDKLDSFEMEM